MIRPACKASLFEWRKRLGEATGPGHPRSCENARRKRPVVSARITSASIGQADLGAGNIWRRDGGMRDRAGY